MSDSWGQEDRREELSPALASGAYTAVDWTAGLHWEKQGWTCVLNTYATSSWRGSHGNLCGSQDYNKKNWKIGQLQNENVVLWLHKPGPISPSLACFTLYLCTNQTTMQVESRRNPVLREGPLGSQHHPPLKTDPGSLFPASELVKPFSLQYPNLLYILSLFYLCGCLLREPRFLQRRQYAIIATNKHLIYTVWICFSEVKGNGK